MALDFSIREEAQDVLAAQAGDARAFERLYRSHVRRVFALCARMSGSRTMAEDLTQEAFVKAWEHLASYRGEAPFLSWLYRLAANTVVSEARTRNRRPHPLEVVQDLDELPGRAGREAPEFPVDLEGAIAALPPGARTVFVLFDVYGFTHEEISGITGQAPGTSKAQLHRARKLLREVLQ